MESLTEIHSNNHCFPLHNNTVVDMAQFTRDSHSTLKKRGILKEKANTGVNSAGSISVLYCYLYTEDVSFIVSLSTAAVSECPGEHRHSRPEKIPCSGTR